MAARPEGWLTPEAYLALERKAETKSEYVDGTLVAMSGTTREHSMITVNISSSLHAQLRGRPCEVHSPDLRVRIAESVMYAYPDVVVVCGEPQFEDDQFDVLLNPSVIIEVLSPTTEAYDRGLKFAHYRLRASLQDYVLVAQDRVSVERYSRRDGEWVLTEATSLDDVIELPSIGCTLALRDVYARIEQVSGAPAPPA
jgi:Uma2 family endonuclease